MLKNLLILKKNTTFAGTTIRFQKNMQEQLVGRVAEQQLLKSYLQSGKSEFIAVYGRRRVGKTFLIRHVIGEEASFAISGMENVSTDEQLLNFSITLNRYGKGNQKYTNWLEAFDALISYLEALPNGNKIVFIDEMPWMDTPSSRFISSLEHFWNDWASARSDIKLIVCGSATSWMMDNLINNHGGLHNRVTHQLLLEPFTLGECREYFTQYGFGYGEREIIDCYMVLGGIPYYFSLMDSAESIAQNIDRLFFSPTGELRYEMSNLFRSLFRHSDAYVSIVKALSQKAKGLTRAELLEATKLHNNAHFTKMLDELEYCRFIRKYQDYSNKARQTTYQLIDSFVHFYYSIIAKNQYQDEQFWSHSILSPAYHAWSGFAYEILCLNHIRQIKSALGISGIQTQIYSWRAPKEIVSTIGKGAQIDLLIDRADNCINVCEIKFATDKYIITKAYEETLRNKLYLFGQTIGKRKTLRLTMITTYGVLQNQHSHIVQNEITMEQLFG